MGYLHQENGGGGKKEKTKGLQRQNYTTAARNEMLMAGLVRMDTKVLLAVEQRGLERSSLVERSDSDRNRRTPLERWPESIWKVGVEGGASRERKLREGWEVC
ncbi:hypothetical protein V6N13_019792 [Hibiscus sabdariffa]